MPSNTGKLPAPSRGVTWIPGIGPRTYGPCTRLLAIDGGGIRGIVPALLLAEIEKRTGVPTAYQFDAIAGTSTGAILAFGLTRPSDADVTRPAFAADFLVDFYREHAREVFPSSYALLRKLRWIFSPKYDPAPLEALLDQYFGNVRLEEALTNVLVPAYAIELNQRMWFSRLGTPELLMKDVLRGAIAAPTYIPPARIAVTKDLSSKGYVSLVDGGLFANNPSLQLLTTFRSWRAGGDRSLLLLSLGTGAGNENYSFEQTWSWGVVGWVNPLLEMSFDVRPNEAEVQRLMEGNDYWRLQVTFSAKAPAPALDDTRNGAIDEMVQRTNTLIAEQGSQLDSIVTFLKLPRSPRCGGSPGLDREQPKGPRSHP